MKQDPAADIMVKKNAEVELLVNGGVGQVQDVYKRQEVAIFADKVAVDEENVRLRSHFQQLQKLLDSEGPVGRKIDFLVQEMNRESNTIGSKSVNSKIAYLVVDIKALIEKIREQVQNVE